MCGQTLCGSEMRLRGGCDLPDVERMKEAMGEAEDLVLKVEPEERDINGTLTLRERLRQAVRDNNVTSAEALIDQGARVNAVARGTHATVLISAAFQNDVEMVDMLLLRGALPNVFDEAGMAPLHYAAAWGYDTIVEQLMAAGADPTAGNLEGVCPGDLARTRGHTQTSATLQKWIDAR